jgi:drug/metabolite transporter (DMT)-like permease
MAETSSPGQPALTGILLVTGGALIFSINDMAVKHLSGSYALHQIILIRALIGMTFLFVIAAPSATGYGFTRTRRPGLHLLRVSVILISNVTYFTGLARMAIADAAAVAYISPLVVTALSVVVLGEKVGPRRWTAVLIGLAGIVVMLRPGAGVIQPAALLVLISAVLYALGNLLTRRMGGTESAMTLAFHVQLGFILASGAMGVLTWAGLLAALEAGHRLPPARHQGPVRLSRRRHDPGPRHLDRRHRRAGQGGDRVPGNAARGRPTIHGAVTLFDDVTGELTALLDFHLVTKWKTAGDSLLSASRLARKDSRRILLVGAVPWRGRWSRPTAACSRMPNSPSGRASCHCGEHGHAAWPAVTTDLEKPVPQGRHDLHLHHVDRAADPRRMAAAPASTWT